MDILNALSRRLSEVSRKIDVATTRLSTGKRVGTAADDSSTWAMARSLADDRMMLETMDRGSSTARTWLEAHAAASAAALETFDTMQALLLQALEPGADKAMLGLHIEQAKSALESIVNTAAMNGNIWALGPISGSSDYYASGSGAAPSYTVPVSYRRMADGSISIGKSSMAKQDVLLLDTNPNTGTRWSILAAATLGLDGNIPYYFELFGNRTMLFGLFQPFKLSAASSASLIRGMINALDTYRDRVQVASTVTGVLRQGLDRQSVMNGKMSDIISRALSRMVDANLGEDAARLKALQVQADLSRQALALESTSRVTSTLKLLA